MTTTTLTSIGIPPARPFSQEECAALARAGIIDASEQSDVLAGRHRFTVDEYLAMEVAGILHEDDPVELIDGVIIIMPPIGDRHTDGTDWATTLFVPPLLGRATVQLGGPVYLNDDTAPQPDVVLKRWKPLGSGVDQTRYARGRVPGHRVRRQFPGLRPGRQAGPVCRRRHTGGVGSQPAGAGSDVLC